MSSCVCKNILIVCVFVGVHNSRALISVGCELTGFARLSASNADVDETSLAARLMQYAWTHWDDPVDVCIKQLLKYH